MKQFNLGRRSVWRHCQNRNRPTNWVEGAAEFARPASKPYKFVSSLRPPYQLARTPPLEVSGVLRTLCDRSDGTFHCELQHGRPG